MSLEHALRRSVQERQRRRLSRQAYASLYARLAHLVPVVLPAAGTMQAFAMPVDVRRSGASWVFCFETALELWKGRRLLTARDWHAYCTEIPDGLGRPAAPTPSLTPAFPRDPQLFLIQVPVLPEWVAIPEGRVVTADRLMREYLGTLGHRFDLLAVAYHSLRDELLETPPA